MTTTGSNTSTRGGRPPWLIPAAAATMIVLLIGVLVLVVSDNDDNSAPANTLPPTVAPITEPDAADPAVSDVPATDLPAATSPSPTEAVATDAPATAPPGTEPPGTDPSGTDPPSSTPVSGTTPDRLDQAPAAALATLRLDQASIAGPFGSSLFDVVVTCESTDAGNEILTSLLTNSEGDIVLADLFRVGDEQAVLVLSHMNAEIDRLFSGTEGDAGAQWFGSLSTSAALDQRSLLSGNDAAFGGVTISMHPQESHECTTGFMASPWPFAPVLKPEFIERSNEVWKETRGFAVLARCGGGLIVSQAGLLGTVEIDGNLGGALLKIEGDEIRFFATPDPFEPTDFLIEQDESPGEITFVVRVEEVGGESRNEGYLSWTLATGDGLATVDCPSS